jgi:uncharacterized membrane protein HdeD (DUF308 family)
LPNWLLFVMITAAGFLVAVFRAVVFFRAVLFLRPVALRRAVVLRPVVFLRAAVFFRRRVAAAFLARVFRVVAAFRPAALRVVRFLARVAAAFRPAVLRRAVVFFRPVVFRRAVVFFRPVVFRRAVVFLRAVVRLRPVVFRRRVDAAFLARALLVAAAFRPAVLRVARFRVLVAAALRAAALRVVRFLAAAIAASFPSYRRITMLRRGQTTHAEAYPMTATDRSPLVALARSWWMLLLRGIAAILFGVLAFVWPGITVLALVFLFAAFALVDGILAFVAAWRAAEARRQWWPMALEGVAGVAVAVLTAVWPGATAFALLFLIAAWAFVTGVFEIAAAIRLRKVMEGEWLLALVGIASIVFAALILVFPGEGAVAIVWAIGAYAIVFGILLIALSLRLRSLKERLESAPAPA